MEVTWVTAEPRCSCSSGTIGPAGLPPSVWPDNDAASAADISDPDLITKARCPQKPIPPLMSLQHKTPPVDDGWEDEPLCSIDASPGPESGLLAAAAPSADTPRGPVPGQPSVTPAMTPILPWTPDQAGPATPTVLQELVN